MQQLDRDGVNCENMKRANQDIALFNELPSFSGLELVRVPLQAADRNDHRHSAIKEGQPYLVCSDGRWSLVKICTAYSGGWEFNDGWTRKGLGWADLIYEVQGLPAVPAHILEHLPMPPEVQDEDEEDEI